MFWHIFKNKIITLLHNKGMMFWTLVFPIILGTLFNLAFSNIIEKSKLTKIEIAVVKIEDNKNLEAIINNLSKESDYQLFNTRYVTEQEAKNLLEQDEISGYIKMGQEVEIIVKENSIEQTIIKYIVDQYYQMSSVTKNTLEYNKDVLANGVLKVFIENKEYFNDTSNENMDSTVNYFYALIGMTCLFGGFFGMYIINGTEANLSAKGARVSIAPVHKLKLLLAGLLAGLLIHYINVLVLIAYLVFILKINFGSRIIYILIISFFGCLAGISTGMLIGIISKRSEGLKSAILVATTMMCSFLSGMMIMEVKYIIANKVPILAKINPVNMITDGLYSLYCYSTLDRFWNNTASLAIFTICIILISYIFIRRKKYDSI